jgi:iron complex transport system permease protein
MFLLSRTSGLIVLLSLLIFASVGATLNGAFQIDFRAIFDFFTGKPQALDDISRNVLFGIRIPRVLLGILAGAALGLTGAVMQALFRNPLAEPGLVGLSAGASLGAVAAIVLSTGGFLLISMSAFICSVLTTYITYLLGRLSNSASGLLLAGIAINAIIFSIVGLIIINANDAQLRDLTFWNMGSLASANWQVLGFLSPIMFFGMILLLRHWRMLNALLLGEREAHHLGFALKPLRRQLIILVAMVVGPMVTGGIGFVGLVMPHLVRMLLGADHRWVLPASAISGAFALTLADWLARTLISPAELPIGLITSLVGAPFFVWLLYRGRTR